VLLVGAGLMLQTMARLRAIDIGFRSDHLLLARTIPHPARYGTQAARAAFAERVLDGVRTLPGVEGAAYVSVLPFTSYGNTTGYRVEGRILEPSDPGDALHRIATGDYLRTLGVRLLEGRLIDNNDGAGTTPVVVVNESFARRYWPGESAVGHRVFMDSPTPDSPPAVWRTIVGVVADVRERGYELSLKPGIYQPLAQAPYGANELMIRVNGDPLSLAPAVRRAIAAVDAEQPVSGLRTMDDILDTAIADRQQQLTLLGTFAGLALLLASVGIYGVLSYAVTQRSREIGLRMALGASAGSVVRMVVGRGSLLTGSGLVIGLGASWALTRWMKNLLFGIEATDMATFGAVAALLAAVGLLACWIPARRASRVDPIVVLREE
jgi:putative ABC transport system permease protein